MSGFRCYDRSRIFKPQWAGATPAGFRYEDFWLPFNFQVPANGLIQKGFPWRLDDDVPFLLRAVVFSQIGLGQQVLPAQPVVIDPPVANSPVPALCRITDTSGNPFSPVMSPPVLALGVISQSGFGAINAFGFPVEPPVMCSPGGVLVFDFQISSNGHPFFLTLAGVAESIQMEGNFFPGPNSFPISLTLTDTGVANTPLSVTAGFVGPTFAIAVTLQDDAGGLLVTTYADLMALLNGTPAIAAVITSTIQGTNPAEVLTTGVNAPPMFFNADFSTTVNLQGTLIGSKCFTDC